MKSPQTPAQSFIDFLRADNRYTSRDLMKALGVGHPALKQREADPSLFTVGELLVLADLLGCDRLELIKMVFAELDRNPKALERVEEAAEQVIGRQRFPRTPKQVPGDTAL